MPRQNRPAPDAYGPYGSTERANNYRDLLQELHREEARLAGYQREASRRTNQRIPGKMQVLAGNIAGAERAVSFLRRELRGFEQ